MADQQSKKIDAQGPHVNAEKRGLVTDVILPASQVAANVAAVVAISKKK